jgi:hypothetical protein
MAPPGRYAPSGVLHAVESDELEVERSETWAFEQAMGAVWYYRRTNPLVSAMGRCTLRRAIAHTAV